MKKLLQNKSLALFLLIILSFAAGFFWKLKGGSQQRDRVKVVWKKQSPPEYVYAKNPTNVKAKKNDRAPASSPGAKFIVKDGMKKLVVNLKFVCSSWTYLYQQFSPDSVGSWCLEYAASQTHFVNTVYRNSKIPVYFEYTATTDLQAWKNMLTTRYSEAEITQAMADFPESTAQLAINNVSASNPYIMPAVQIIDLKSLLKYNPQMDVVDKSIPPVKIPEHDLNQTWYPRNIFCDDPNSTDKLKYFEKSWGMTISQFDRIRWEVNGQMVPVCGGFGCSSFQRLNAATQKCEFLCICYHRNVWGSPSGSYWSQNGCGDPVPGGRAAEDSTVNKCGYTVAPQAQSWTGVATTLWPVTGQAEVILEDNTFKWLVLNKTKGYQFMSKTGEYSIVIAVRPFATPVVIDGVTYKTAGQAPVVDITSRYVYASLGFGIPRDQEITLPKGEDFFKMFGAVLMNLDTSAAGVLSHEIGHMFGGRHERSLNENVGHPVWTEAYLLEQRLGAFEQISKPAKASDYATIMHSKPKYYIDYFSTRSFKTTDGRTLGVHEDNRAQIVKTLSYIAGEQLEKVPSREKKAIFIINQFLFR